MLFCLWLSVCNISLKCGHFLADITSYSLLPALSINGMIHVKILEGSFITSLFYDLIEGLLDKMQPFPLPNSVIVMDNACIHKDPHILDLIEEWLVRRSNFTSLN